MSLHFNINYNTVFGQELILNVIDGVDDGEERISQYHMSSYDGKTWQYTMRKGITPGGRFDYFYSVNRGDVCERTEWRMISHRLEISERNAENYICFDNWIDIPDDSYLYTSAFKDCVSPSNVVPVKEETFNRTVRLKVRAPQLKKGQSLAVVGKGDALGNWDPDHCIELVQHNDNEWIVDLDADTLNTKQLEFKFFIRDKHNDYAPIWEATNNRVVDLIDIHNGDVVVYSLPEAGFDIYPIKLAGTLVPVFSLRSKTSFGVGDFGDVKKMIEFIAKTHQRVLQILPINDTTTTHTWTDSYPYSCISIFALHPQYVDLTQLPPIADAAKRKKFEELRQELNELPQIDYERVNNAKTEYLHIIFEQEGKKVLASEKFKKFFKETEQWLVPYAEYCYLRDVNGTADFSKWPDHNQWSESDRAELTSARTKAYKTVSFYYFVQYILNTQMEDVHKYARAHGVILKGDIPIGVNRYGCDVWSEPRYFNLNGQAGAPPDAFSTNGQNWGFPTYNWDEMIKDGCLWWVRRFKNMAKFFDAYRIDHVLGFFRIWEIPVPEKSGLMGQFSPALGLSREEIEAYGVQFNDGLFLVDHKRNDRWHPRIAVQYQEAYNQLNEDQKYHFNQLYNDYFYRRNNQFWYTEAMKKLPKLTQATRMLVCAEDLGMVPDCVPWVMNELRILSLEIQSMPKDPTTRFGHLSRNPYRSVDTISTHDMPTLRQWWDEDEERTQSYFNTMLFRGGPAPHPLPDWLAKDIVSRHLTSPSMLCLLSFQDWISIDDGLRLPDENAERINIPANPRHYWRYRMHLTIEQLLAADDLNNEISTLIIQSGRK